ncbi:MAG: hypothetical protein ACI4UL_08595, partial [Muribaculaceae bacterium]
FYAQEEQFSKQGRYFGRIEDFGLTSKEMAMLPAGAKISVEAISHYYEITITKADGKQIYIDQDGYLRRR